ncbi:helix-turn-helix transcriptional regulator [Agrobacterium vitis]|uniref:XRE family transcriptional regulator n=1 Tax=Agrobacterium vitis TaxID=373 RepID=UPI0012E77327|nr:XRE family transcriptional regulator [Agrobacterium vitis]MVA52576.1 helix-turn-helix transcriptional regulator [Agrobacterium vitis]
MTMDIATYIAQLLSMKKWNQVKLAAHFGVSQSTVNRWKSGSEPEGHHRDAIRELYNMEFGTPDSKPFKRVKLMGKVGAGQEIYAIDDGGQSDVDAPADAHQNTVAVEVSGESMYPAYEEGTILFYSKTLPPSEMVNRRAVVQLADGRIFVKTVRPGTTPNTWTLTSINALYPDMIDQIVEWAAPIDWIKPR